MRGATAPRRRLRARLGLAAGLALAAAVGLAAALALTATGSADAQHVHPSAPSAPAGQAGSGSSSGAGPASQAGQDGASPKSIRITMEALHAAGGTPPGWRFSLPGGDAAAGRRAFVDLKCYACHAIQGEQFPLAPGQAATAGPDLTGMAHHHPVGYLVESILNPSAVLVEGPGYIGGDGRSIMPEQREMTVAQLVDLVAYLRSVGGAESRSDGRRESAEQTAGRYRVRLRYVEAGGGHEHGAGGHEHASGGHAHHGGMPAAGRLVAVVLDQVTGQPVPYLPVRARIETPGQSPATLTLAPELGAEGLVYAAATAAPARARRIVLTIGAATARLSPGDHAAFARAETVTFDWR